MLYKSLMGVSAYKSGDKLEMGVAVVVVRQVNEFGGIKNRWTTYGKSCIHWESG